MSIEIKSPDVPAEIYGDHPHKVYPNEWAEDCLRYQGVVLDGDFAHWCPEWDDMPIDETCAEYELCYCFREPPRASNESRLLGRIVDTVIWTPLAVIGLFGFVEFIRSLVKPKEKRHG